MEEPDRRAIPSDPNCHLQLDVEPQVPIDPASFKFAPIITRLIDLFGEHPVRTSSGGADGSKLKFFGQAGLDWKVRLYRHVIDTMSSWLLRPEPLETLTPVFGSYGTFSATRCGGALRHEIERLTWSDNCPYSRANVTPSISTRRIANDQLSALQETLAQFFTKTARHGARYGQGWTGGL